MKVFFSSHVSSELSIEKKNENIQETVHREKNENILDRYLINYLIFGKKKFHLLKLVITLIIKLTNQFI